MAAEASGSASPAASRLSREGVPEAGKDGTRYPGAGRHLPLTLNLPVGNGPMQTKDLYMTSSQGSFYASCRKIR